MRLFPLVVALLLGSSLPARAQQLPDNFQRSWSIEMGTGMQPWHMSYVPRKTEIELAEKGQSIGKSFEYYPAFSLGVVYRPYKWTEFAATLGTAWRYYELIQYPVFGTDPDGNPRYDLYDGSYAGWKHTNPVFSLVLRCHHIWNPGRAVELYTGGGLGICTMAPVPLPEFTPIAARFAGDHFYIFLELTLGPIATLAHAGLGWRF
jgi:hypothetical protein